jgi:hypothetical protein
MRSADQVESFSLQGVGVVMDTLTPNVAGMAIKSQGPDLHPYEVALLCRLVLEAAEQQCGDARACEFVPQYAIRFRNAEGALDLLIELGCLTLGFRRGREDAAVMPGYSGNAYCISDSLSFLVHGLFQDKADFRRMSAN